MEPAQGRSAPYGRACYSCFKTKCKCVPRLEGDECERCFRLQRQCYPADTLRRRTEKKPSSSDARISKVEDTLSQLVGALQGWNGDPRNGTLQQQPPPQQQPMPSFCQHQYGSTRPGEDHSRPDSDPFPTAEDAVFDRDMNDTDASASSASISKVATDSRGHRSDYDTNVGVEPADGFLPPRAFASPTSGLPPPPTGASPIAASSSSSAESASLDTFRSRMLQHFPIVHLPVDCTAEQLQNDRPFLLRAIVCVTTRSSDDRQARALELKRVMCAQAFLQQTTEATETVDLLLGLLVYIGWGWDHLCSSNPRDDVSRLMSLAASLVGELRPRVGPAAAEPARTIRLLEPRPLDTTETMHPASETPYARLERYRAILGCFMLGSAVATYFDRTEAPRWTPEMDEGLAAIGQSDAAVYPSDAILALQVRLQLLGTRAAQIRYREPGPGQPPAALSQIRSLMGELQFLRTSISVELQQHFGLLAHTYYTEFCIIKTIHEMQHLPLPNNPPSTVSTTTAFGPSRLSCLWQTALAIRSFTSTCLTLSPCADMRGISFAQWTQFSHCLAALHQLDTLREPGWGPGALRRLVDVPELLAGAVETLETAAAAEAAEDAAEAARWRQSSSTLSPPSLSLGLPPSPSASLPASSTESAFLKLAHGLRKFQSTYHAKETRPKATHHSEVSKDDVALRGPTGSAAAAAGLPGLTEGPPLAAEVDGQQGGCDLSIVAWFDQFLVTFDEQSAVVF